MHIDRDACTGASLSFHTFLQLLGCNTEVITIYSIRCAHERRHHGQYKDHTVKIAWGQCLRLLLCLSETAGGRINTKRLVAASPDISHRPGGVICREQPVSFYPPLDVIFVHKMPNEIIPQALSRCAGCTLTATRKRPSRH